MSHMNRRAMLRALSMSPFVLTGVGVFSAADRAAAQAIGLVAPNVCMVTPEVTEGPYYLGAGLMRSDITEGKDGIPMSQEIQVVDASCTPIEGARVDIWHCDAEGNYSGYSNQGSDRTVDTSDQTFLRGSQMTDARGVVRFETIYPGWYRGRTTHIHYKVWLDDRTILTSQIFYPDALSEYLFQTVPPYNNREANRDTTNTNDWIAKQAGDGAFAMIREQPGRYEAALVVGINEDASAADTAPGAGGPPPGGPGQSDAGVFVPGSE